MTAPPDLDPARGTARPLFPRTPPRLPAPSRRSRTTAASPVASPATRSANTRPPSSSAPCHGKRTAPPGGSSSTPCTAAYSLHRVRHSLHARALHLLDVDPDLVAACLQREVQPLDMTSWWFQLYDNITCSTASLSSAFTAAADSAANFAFCRTSWSS